MVIQNALGGTFTLPGTRITVHRFGYGAMQLAGPHVFGPPKDPEAAVAVLREAVALGIDHIDTSDYYGPHVTNQLIKQALHPYKAGLTLVTKVGCFRGPDASWNMAHSAADLEKGVLDNLKNLGLDALDVVNLRLGGVSGPDKKSLEAPMTAMADLQRRGLVKHIGLSTVSAKQLREAEKIAPVVCVQNHYNLAHREDDAFIDELAGKGIAYVPYFPLGGFSPLQSSTLSAVAVELKATPMQVAQAWLLHRSPNILLIPGTSSVAHLRENVAAAALSLSKDVLARLDGIAAAKA